MLMPSALSLPVSLERLYCLLIHCKNKCIKLFVTNLTKKNA